MIEPPLPRRDPRGADRPLKLPRRLIVDTVLYLPVSGCARRPAPHASPRGRRPTGGFAPGPPTTPGAGAGATTRRTTGCV
ncbi:hypothetical protein [Kitasatospora sp. NPDC004531]